MSKPQCKTKAYLTCSNKEKYFSFHSFLSRKTLAISNLLIRRPSEPVGWPTFIFYSKEYRDLQVHAYYMHAYKKLPGQHNYMYMLTMFLRSTISICPICSFKIMPFRLAYMYYSYKPTMQEIHYMPAYYAYMYMKYTYLYILTHTIARLHAYAWQS